MADDKNPFSFNEFVSKFDVVTSSYLSSHDEIHRFLDILNSENLHEKYEFVFPLFYDFKISNGEVLFLPKANGESYEWLISNSGSIKERVAEHTSYGIGITESYCKSAVPPSYLKIKLSSLSKDTIDVTIKPYNNNLFCKDYPSLYINTTKLVVNREIVSVDDNRGQKLKPVSDELKVNWTDLDSKQVIEKQKPGLDIVGLEKGIKAHYPIIENGKSVLYYFFTNNLQVKDDKKSGFGGLFVIAKKELDDAELGFFILAGYTLANKVALSQIQHSARIEAIKSAIAAIMSRNMSHNLGSHDISNTKNYFGRRANDGCLYRNAVTDDELKLLRSDYRGNVRLLQYIQERMDFIATIVSTDHYPFGPLNFKAEFFDVLTNDDCGERHGKPERNFLLLYLLYSEKYTRISVNPKEDYGNVRLVVIDNDGTQYTGLNRDKTIELDIKTELSKLLLAVPGGVMSRHALFTIVENILRNSAKHNRHVDDLVLTIKVKEEGNKIKLSFYDNCISANEKVLADDGNEVEVWESIKRKLDKIIIIDNNGAINKHDKGLKEMLICALWLQNKDVAETLFNIQNGNDRATNYLGVGTEGNNLCYTVTLEKFEKCHVIMPNSDQKVSEGQLLNIHADFVVSDKDYPIGHRKLSDIFPRFFQGGEDDIRKNIKEINNRYSLVVEIPESGAPLPSGVVLRNDQKELGNSKERICFYDHLTNSEKQSGFETAKRDPKIVYLDSISGENFTSTLVTPGFLNDEVLRYKVIQSALTRIAILDERIWNNYRSGCKFSSDLDKSKKSQYQNALNKLTGTDKINEVLTIIKGIDEKYYTEVNHYEEKDDAKYMQWLQKSLQDKIETKLFTPDITCQLLETRNISVYTIENGKLIGLDGNEVEKVSEFDFVTVHLGLIEKLPKNSRVFETFLDKQGFRKTDEHRPFISIHSGRGNFSPELEDSLKDYPFLSLSALESALNNSKYLLSELFYNTNYYGKGNINHK